MDKTVNTFLLIAGFALWAYGFSYSSFWYANEGASLFEPLRVWLTVQWGIILRPGFLEQLTGLAGAFLGATLKVRHDQ